jgi:hypothetical protein
MSWWDRHVIWPHVDCGRDGRARSIAMRLFERRYPKWLRMKNTVYPRFSGHLDYSKPKGVFVWRVSESGRFLIQKRLERQREASLSKIHFRDVSGTGSGHWMGKNGQLSPFVQSAIMWGCYRPDLLDDDR